MSSGKIISADSHVKESDEVYRVRLPERFRHRVPRIEVRDGKRYRIVEGRKPRRMDLADERLTEEDTEREFRTDPTGGADIARRLKDQDRDGVGAEVIYANDALGLFQSPDAEYQNAMAVAYNDWAIELFGARKDRFAPVAVLPVADLAWSVREVQRLAKLGYRAVKLPITVKGRPYNLPEYEPLWRAIEETGLVLSLHSFTNDEDLYPADWGEEDGVGGALVFMAMRMADGQYPVAEIISSGALQRHPKLKFVVVECGSGWLAWLLHVLDEQAHKKHMWIRPRLEMLPSEFFRRQGHVTFTDDPVALANLKFTGADGLLWGSDYPHDEGSFPHSREVIERTFAGVSEADKKKIVHDNAARLYGFA